MAKTITFTGVEGSVDVDTLTIEDLGTTQGKIPQLDEYGQIPETMIPKQRGITVRVDGQAKGELLGIDIDTTE